MFSIQMLQETYINIDIDICEKCQDECEVIYCDTCDNVYCLRCCNFLRCNTCENISCDECIENFPMLYCNYDCEEWNCEECIFTEICILCRKGKCDECIFKNENEQIYTCDYCKKTVCTMCKKMEFCGDCDSTVCIDCVKYCACEIHCKSCVPKKEYVSLCGNLKCKNIYCELCCDYCVLCNKTLCNDCVNIDACKECKSNMILYKDNLLYKTFPNEIINMIVKLIKN